jgi:hypothetical protein
MTTKLRMLGGAALLILSVGHGSPRARHENVDLVPLLCPRAEGLCLWSPKQGWKRVVPSFPADWVEAQQVPDGRVVALVRGHGGAGVTYVLDQSGAIMVARKNGIQAGLSRLMGWDEHSNIVLCGENPDTASCDVVLPHEGVTGKLPADLPADCLFPRYLRDGRSVCLRLFPSPGVVITDLDGRTESEITVPDTESMISDFYTLSVTRFIFRAGNSLVLFEKGRGLTPLSTKGDGVLWSTAQDNAIVYGVCSLASERAPRLCKLIRLDLQSLGNEVLWSSDRMVPMALQRLNGDLILDVWGQGERKIVRLPKRPRPGVEVLWSETATDLWK